ncbi:MAG: hypothetical protein OJF52_000812 [Nitrospira sp.]|nr:MAG: hypothetical protein OJF52_000812 [Nitrospira sp.]
MEASTWTAVEASAIMEHGNPPFLSGGGRADGPVMGSRRPCRQIHCSLTRTGLEG